MWDPRRLTILWAFTAHYRDNFTFENTLCEYRRPIYVFVLNHRDRVDNQFFTFQKNLMYCNRRRLNCSFETFRKKLNYSTVIYELKKNRLEKATYRTVLLDRCLPKHVHKYIVKCKLDTEFRENIDRNNLKVINCNDEVEFCYCCLESLAISSIAPAENNSGMGEETSVYNLTIS
jgi:hypothetical protein